MSTPIPESIPWITAGDTPAEISLAYATATGFVPMMPEYGLGFWQCKLRYWNQEQLLEVAREYKRRGLPVDVIVVVPVPPFLVKVPWLMKLPTTI